MVAGVDSIEHGSLIDDEGIQLMLKQGTWLVADIYNDDYLLGKAIEFKLPQESIDKERALGQLQRDNFARPSRPASRSPSAPTRASIRMATTPSSSPTWSSTA